MRTVKTPVETNHSLRAMGVSLKQEPAGNREELLLQPTTGLESPGFGHGEDVNCPESPEHRIRPAADAAGTGSRRACRRVVSVDRALPARRRRRRPRHRPYR